MIHNPGNVEYRNEFIGYRNKLNALIRKTKTHYLQNQILNFNSNPKKLWNFVNNTVNYKTKEKAQMVQAIKQQSSQVIVDDAAGIADEFNKYFITVGPNLSKNLSPLGITSDSESEIGTSHTAFLFSISETELHRI